MARNAEKAMTALARFRQAQLEEGKVKERRPFLASECNELPKAEKWRRQIIGEISKKVAQIQNAGLGEFRIRDLNDEINKLLREKGHWEVRIKELGGPDYARVGPKMLDHEGKEVPGNRGYKYFGAAKDLPGVRELFEKEPLPPPRKTRAELMKAIDAEYYGYRDEDDGVLEPLEQEHEKRGRACHQRHAPAQAREAGGPRCHHRRLCHPGLPQLLRGSGWDSHPHPCPASQCRTIPQSQGLPFCRPAGLGGQPGTFPGHLRGLAWQHPRRPGFPELGPVPPAGGGDLHPPAGDPSGGHHHALLRHRRCGLPPPAVAHAPLHGPSLR
ncbi:pre-mRNA-splicing factor ISY1 homolog isoform X2 [Carettochelys insculpta]|uniref:pre-mRNA-splicing factor ISY1 homolog isoform X2 n=1 Tax=Carettochelys insculpta TaxID=44489 RepID=UPI003EBF119A